MYHHRDLMVDPVAARLRGPSVTERTVRTGFDTATGELVLTLTPERAQELARFLAQVESHQASARDSERAAALTVEPEAREEWTHVLIDILATVAHAAMGDRATFDWPAPIAVEVDRDLSKLARSTGVLLEAGDEWTTPEDPDLGPEQSTPVLTRFYETGEF